MLNKSKEELEKVYIILEQLIQGEDEEFLCKKYDIRPQKFRTILFACEENRKIEINLSPAERIYQNAFKTNNFAKYPSDLDETIPYCMEHFLTNEEKDILNKLYWEKATYEDVASAYNTNSSKIKAITKNALKKLTEKKAVQCIEFGLNYENELKQIREEQTDVKRLELAISQINNNIIKKEMVLTKIQSQYLNVIKDLIIELKNINEEIENDALKNSIKNIQIDKQFSDDIDSTHISKLNIPMKLKNILIENEIIYIRNLKKYTIEQLNNINGIGPYFSNLIAEELKNYNIYLNN